MPTPMQAMTSALAANTRHCAEIQLRLRASEAKFTAVAIGGARMLKPAKFAAIFPAVMLAACYGAPSPSSFEAVAIPSGGWGQGIDMPTDATDNLNELKASRVDFVARYYRDPDSGWPALSPSEAQLLSSQGLKIVAVYEWHSTDPAHFNYASGYSDAMIAYGEARAVGQPAGSAIYFAADFNAQSDEVDAVLDYFRGVNAGLVRYSWLSNSITWDGATDYDDWNIMQGQAMPDLSFDNDADQARSDYGAFQVAGNGAAPSYDVAGSAAPHPAPEQSSTAASLMPLR
jgi:Domain of unknown function (DUF1906)